MKTFIIIVVIIAVIVAFLYYQNNHLVVTKYSLSSKKINNDIKIVQLSDFHSKINKSLLDKVANEKPDIIFVTGDYINDKGKNKAKMLEFEKKLSKLADVYYIPGNHERRLPYFNELMKEISDNSFTVLLNKSINVSIKNNPVIILGLSEKQADKQDYIDRKKGIFTYPDMSKYFDCFGDENYNILLSHFAENFELLSEMNYSQYNFDLQLSGHAHGGQFNLPFIGPVYSPGQGLFPKYAKGSFGGTPKLIVNRGMGNAEFPFRLFNYPEIISISVNKEC